MARRHEAHGQRAAPQTPLLARVCQRSAGIAQLASRNEVHAQCSAIASIFFLTNQRKLVSDELVGRADRQPGEGFAHPGAVTAAIQGLRAGDDHSETQRATIAPVYAHRAVITSSFS